MAKTKISDLRTEIAKLGNRNQQIAEQLQHMQNAYNARSGEIQDLETKLEAAYQRIGRLSMEDIVTIEIPSKDFEKSMDQVAALEAIKRATS